MKYLDDYRRLRKIADDLGLRVPWYQSNETLRRRVADVILNAPVPQWRAHQRLDFRWVK